MKCTPSARLEDNEPESRSDFAEEGTLAHELAEMVLRHHLKQITLNESLERLSKAKQNKFYADEMEDYVRTYVDYVLSRYYAAGKGALLLLEERVDLTHYIPEGFGSNDAIIIADGAMEVIDLKYGKGVRVSAVDNSQLKLYGLGALRKYEMLYDIEKVVLTIHQPRLDAVSNWEISADDLRTWGSTEVRTKAELAHAGKGEFVVGDHCKFCKVKARCKAQAANADKLAAYDFKEPSVLTDEEILKIYEAGDVVMDWLNSVNAYVFAQALDGKTWPGYKLVEGRSTRKWSDEDAVARKLVAEGLKADEIFETTLKGITAIEKIMGKKDFVKMSELVFKAPGKPALVPESDKRSALNSAAEDFKPF